MASDRNEFTSILSECKPLAIVVAGARIVGQVLSYFQTCVRSTGTGVGMESSLFHTTVHGVRMNGLSRRQHRKRS